MSSADHTESRAFGTGIVFGSTACNAMVKVALGLIFVVYIAAGGWCDEDIYISFRVLENFFQGYGMTFNPPERVMVITEPLWMYLQIPLYGVLRNPILTVVIASSVAVAAMAAIALSIARSAVIALLLFLIPLSLSYAFTTYSVSGFAAPHILLACMVFTVLALKRWNQGVRLLAVVAVVCAMGRYDTALIFIPFFVFTLLSRIRRDGAVPAIKSLAAEVWPAAALLAVFLGAHWIYYGFPFPNTFYAKVTVGVPRADIIRQGLDYVVDLVVTEPQTLVFAAAILAILAVRLVRGRFGAREGMVALMAAGFVLYTLYMISVGGDYQSARLLTPVAFGAVFLTFFLLADAEPARKHLALAFLAVAVAAAASEVRALRGAAFFRQIVIQKALGGWTDMSLAGNYLTDMRIENAKWVKEGRRMAELAAQQEPGHRYAVYRSSIGMAGYFSSPAVHLIDVYALSDALLARLPILRGSLWRIGHFQRQLPIGYDDHLRGTGEIEDPDLRVYQRALETIIAGDIVSFNRLKTMLAFNMGRYEKHRKRFLERYAFMIPGSIMYRDIGPENAVESNISAVPGGNPNGFLVYGPFVDLPAGTYRAEMDLSVDGQKEACQSYWTIITPLKSVWQETVPCAAGNHTLTRDFTVAPDDPPQQYQFKVWFGNDVGLTVQELRVRRIGQD